MKLKSNDRYSPRKGVPYSCTSKQRDGILSMRCLTFTPSKMSADLPNAIWMDRKSAKIRSQSGTLYRCSGTMNVDPVTGNKTMTYVHECQRRPDSISNVLIDDIPATHSYVHYDGKKHLCSSTKNGLSRCRCCACLPAGISPLSPNAI